MAEQNVIIKITSDTAGAYYVNPSGTVDNVFTFTDIDSRKVSIIDQKGSYKLRFGGVLPGSNMLSRVQNIINTSAVKEVVFDYGDITLTGTLNCQGKKIVFKNGSKIIGTNTLNNGVLDCNLHNQCFTTGTTLTNFRSVRHALSPENFGALGNDSDETVILQKTSDTIITNPKMPRTVKLTSGKKYGTMGWVLHNWNGTRYDQYNINILGEPSAYETNPAYMPIIHTMNNNGFGINVQRATGFSIKGIGMQGNLNIPSATSRKEFYLRDFTTFASGVRDSQYSPHANLVIDAFRNTSVGGNPPDDGYPDWNGTVTTLNPSGLNWYRGPNGDQASGSSGGTMEDISLDGACVNIMVSPNGQSQQAENMTWKNIYANNCKIILAAGQRESKGCVLTNGYTIDRVHTIFDASTYGAQQGTLPYIKGFTQAGSVKRVVNMGTQHTVTFEDLYMEDLFELGNAFCNTGKILFKGCTFTFTLAETPTLIPYTHFSGANLKFESCLFRYYDDLFDKRLTFIGAGLFFDNCYFDAPPICSVGHDYVGHQRMVTSVFKNCYYGAGNSYLFGWDTLKGFKGARQDGSIACGHITVQNQNQSEFGVSSPFDRDMEIHECGGFELTTVLFTTLNYTVNDAARTATINAYITPGKYVLVEDSSSHFMVLGKATTFSSGLTTLVNVPLNIAGGTFTSTPYVIADYQRFKGRFTGIYTTGSPNITNIFGDVSVGEKDLFTGFEIYSYNSTTKVAVLTGNANFTSDGESYSPAVDFGTSTIRYMRKSPPVPGYYDGDTTKYFPGDIWVAEPIDGTGQPSTKRYICKVSGYINPTAISETKQSVWVEENLYSQFKQTGGPFTSNFNVVVGTGIMMNGILISPRTAPVTINIGTTTGGTDIANGIVVASGADKAFTFPFYTSATKTLYITGVTSSGSTVYYNIY
jgi:hypothetical protein